MKAVSKILQVLGALACDSDDGVSDKKKKNHSKMNFRDISARHGHKGTLPAHQDNKTKKVLS